MPPFYIGIDGISTLYGIDLRDYGFVNTYINLRKITTRSKIVCMAPNSIPLLYWSISLNQKNKTVIKKKYARTQRSYSSSFRYKITAHQA